MLITTTDAVEGRKIREHNGIVSGEAIVGANLFRDLFAGVRDIFGGRSGSYEKAFKRARDTALQDLETEAVARGADAVVGVTLDYEVIGARGSMLMVSANGTAVRLS